MRLFLDSANLREIQEALALGLIQGVTTNPSLMSKESKDRNYMDHMSEIISLFGQAEELTGMLSADKHLSVEVFALTPKEMIIQGKAMQEFLSYKGLAVKIPVQLETIKVIKALSDAGISVNATCCFSESQCILAANAGADYVSIFHARLKDIHGEPMNVIRNVRMIFERENMDTEIIVGSIRHHDDITLCLEAGAHIVTAGLPLLKKLADHPQTTVSVNQFNQDFANWIK